MKQIVSLSLLICLCGALKAQWYFPIYFNTYYGGGAFALNETGNHNAAFGSFAMYNNTTGNYNTAVGAWALYNANATSNVAIGRRAMYNATTGGSNTAVGANALENTTYGVANVAVGADALKNNVTGNWNTAVGHSAGPAFGSGNLIHATAIGYYAVNTSSFQVRIGNDLITDIGGQVSWSTLSDGRFKRDIREDIAGLEFINKLRPVSYTVDHKALAKAHNTPDSAVAQFASGRTSESRQTGFVAQEVEALIKKANYTFNGVKAPQNEHDHYSIRYAEFVVPLVKAVQELTSRLEAQQEELKSLKKQLANVNGAPGTMIEDSRGQGASLRQNYPNPFSTHTEISVSIPENVSSASLVFYTLGGLQLKVIPLHNRGDFNVDIQRDELKSGVYLYSLMVDGKIIESKRLVIADK